MRQYPFQLCWGGTAAACLGSRCVLWCTQEKKGVGYMAWKWIHISLESWMASWWFWYQIKIVQARVSNRTARVSNFLVQNVHIPAYLGSRGKPFFWNFSVFFRMSADLRLVQICTYKFVIYKLLHVKSYKQQIYIYKIMRINLYLLIRTYKITYKRMYVYKLMHTNLYLQIRTYKTI